jgi:hypothetical protein
MNFQTNDGFVFHESLLSYGICEFKNIIKPTGCQISQYSFLLSILSEIKIEKLINRGWGDLEIYFLSNLEGEKGKN